MSEDLTIEDMDRLGIPAEDDPSVADMELEDEPQDDED